MSTQCFRSCLLICRLEEAEFVLTNSANKKSINSIKDFTDEYGDNASFVIGLLADVCRYGDYRVYYV